MPNSKKKLVGADKLFTIGNELIMVDRDVATLFGTTTGPLNQQIDRNRTKFEGFAFRLDKAQFKDLRRQFKERGLDWGASKYPPYVLTEHGVVMAGTVLKTDMAATATRQVVNVFIAARREASRRMKGENLPERLLPTESQAFEVASSSSFSKSVRAMFEKVIAELSKEDISEKVVDEIREVANETLDMIKAKLSQTKIRNKKDLAEIQKLIAEADRIQTEAQERRARIRHIDLALQMKRAMLAAAADEYIRTGDSSRFIEAINSFDVK